MAVSSGAARVFAPALCCALFLALSPVLCFRAEAVEPDTSVLQAEHVVRTSTTRILSLIMHPEYVNPQTREPLRTQIEDEVYHVFDFSEFSARTVGQRWPAFTDRERQDFTDAFADLLFSTYLSQIDGYNGEAILVTGSHANTQGTRVEVDTELTKQDGRVIPISYRLLPKNGSWYVYDVVIEGVSLVRNYRTQFHDILTKSSPEVLIARVRERAQEVAGHAAD